MKLVSWNVNGLRALIAKGHFSWFQSSDPDIFCLQETKVPDDQYPRDLFLDAAYNVRHCAAERKGYSGVATYSKDTPLNVHYGFGGEPRFDSEGRIVISEHAAFTLLNIYFPNGQRDAERLQYKLDFYEATLAYCESLRANGHSIIVCGDVNTAHHPIDLARPRANERTSGFLPIERAWMDRFVEHGYVDTFRACHPDSEGAYSWWSMRTGARQRNVGWRIDYFFVSSDLVPAIVDARIHPDVIGSDHCPVSLQLDPHRLPVRHA